MLPLVVCVYRESCAEEQRWYVEKRRSTPSRGYGGERVLVDPRPGTFPRAANASPHDSHPQAPPPNQRMCRFEILSLLIVFFQRHSHKQDSYPPNEEPRSTLYSRFTALINRLPFLTHRREAHAACATPGA